MRKILLIALLAIVSQMTYAQGIQFFKGTYEEAKAKAKKENKKIFVDAYTTWCGPCKKMAAEVFPTKEVGDYFNKNFICMKLDAENEKDHGFFQSYTASSFPTYFWVDADGVLLDKQSGSTSPSGFVTMAKNAVNNSLGNTMNKLKARWDSGERNPQLVREYVLKMMPTFDASQIYPAMIDYLSKLSPEELNSMESYSLFRGFCGPGDGYFKDDIITKTYFANIKEYEKYENKFSIEIPALSSVLYRTFVRSHTSVYLTSKADEKTKDKEIKKAIKYIGGLDFVYKDLYIDCIKAEQLIYKKNYDDGLKLMTQIIAKYGSEHPTLRGHFIYTIIMSDYCLMETKPQVDAVLKLATDNLKTIPGKTALTYYAVLQFAAGNEKEALSAMAWNGFYNGPIVSNAVYAKMNIENMRKKFPASTPAMDQEAARVKAMSQK